MSLELLQKSLDLVNEGDGIDTGKKKIKKKLNARKRMIEEGKRLLKQVDLDKEFDVDTCEVVRKKKKRGIQRQAIEHSDRLAREGFSYVEQVREQRPPDLMKRNMRYMKFVEQRRVEDDVMARIAGHHLKGADQRKKFVKEILDAKDGKRKKTAKSKSVFTDADFANAASSTIHSLNRQSNKVKLDKKTGKPIVKPTELAKPDFDYDEDEDAEFL